MEKLPGLHALRAIAAIQVFTLHAIFSSPVSHQPVWSFVTSYFNLGVQLFYVVSAFALMHSTKVYASEPDWIARFSMKRFWRIAPLFYVMMVVTAIYTHYAFKINTTPTEIFLNLVFLNNLVPKWAGSLVFAGWSVSVEMMFYGIFPLLFMYIRSLRVAALFLVASFVISEVSRVFFNKIPMPLIGTYSDFAALPQLEFFAFGILAFFGYEKLKNTRFGMDVAPRAILQYHAIFCAAALGLISLIVVFNSTLRPVLRLDMTIWGALFALLTVWFTVREIPALNWTPIQFLGERSYSLYLLHVIIVFSMAPATARIFTTFEPMIGIWALLPALILTYIPVVTMATLTYALIEKPGMDFGRKLRAGVRRRTVIASTN